MVKIHFYLTLFISVFIGSLSHAGYVPSGDFTILTPPPPTVIDRGDPGTPKSETDYFFFQEVDNQVLISPMLVDFLNPVDGFYFQTSQENPGNLAGGITISSYVMYVHNLDGTAINDMFSGTITFTGEQIIGISRQRSTMNDASQDQVEIPGVFYDLQSFDFTTAGGAVLDDFTISSSGTVLSFNAEALDGDNNPLGQFGQMDSLRIITQSTIVPVPEPQTYLLMGSALAFLCCVMKIKKSKRA